MGEHPGKEAGRACKLKAMVLRPPQSSLKIPGKKTIQTGAV